MTDFEHYLEDVVNDRITLRIDIRDADGHQIGHLAPLTGMMAEDADLIAQLTRWRNDAIAWFFTRFIATPARTKDWLTGTVLPDHARLLLLIHDATGLIGQFGFIGLNRDSAELDNLIRGERGGHPNLIYFAEIALIQWLFETFHIQRVVAKLLSHNHLALNLHDSIGFTRQDRRPLRRIATAGEIRFEPMDGATESSEGLYSQALELTTSDFFSRRTSHARRRSKTFAALSSISPKGMLTLPEGFDDERKT